jgi:tRNA dimethylallyltransferase
MIIVTGQTATGKTQLALKLAKKNNGELVNLDSRQIYKELDIITGKDIKPNSKFKIFQSIDGLDIGYYQISKVKIWLYDILSPNQPFSSFQYVNLAKKVVSQIKKNNKVPILVGGSYFYLKHFLYGFDIQVPPNPKLRQELKDKTVTQLQQILQKISPTTFSKLNQSDRANPHRLIRKIEIALSNQSNKSYKTYKTNKTYPIIGLRFSNRQQLVQAIKKRVEQRIKKGAFEEVEFLLKKSYQPLDPGLNTIGYKQLINYFQGKLTKEEAINQWINAEIQYAKRQYTFMKKDPNIEWRIMNVTI